MAEYIHTKLQDYEPGQLYRDPQVGSLYRVEDTTPQAKTRLWQVQRDEAGDGVWQPANSSVYPRFEDAVATLAVMVDTHGLVKWEPEMEELPEMCRSCRCRTCGNEDCPCWDVECRESDRRDCEHFGRVTDDCEDWRPKDGTPGAEPTGAEEPPKTEEAAPEEAAPDETEPESGALMPADAEALTGGGFDYSGLDAVAVDTLHVAERMIFEGRRDYIIATAQAVAIAHEAVVPNWDELHHNQHSENTFLRWCAYVGISKSAAYRFLQVSELLNNSSPEELAALEAASPSLLYAAAKPSAPPALVQAVKDGDITSHKQYQEALEKIRQLEKANASLRDDCASAQRNATDAVQKKQEAQAEAEAAKEEAAEARRRAAAAEARPLEVVGAAPEDIERWRAEGAAAAQREVETMRRYIERREKEMDAKNSFADAEAKKAKQEARQAKEALKGKNEHLAAVERKLAQKEALLKELSPEASVAAVPCCQCIYDSVCMGIGLLNTPGEEQDAVNNRITGCTGGVRKKEER